VSHFEEMKQDYSTTTPLPESPDEQETFTPPLPESPEQETFPIPDPETLMIEEPEVLYEPEPIYEPGPLYVPDSLGSPPPLQETIERIRPSPSYFSSSSDEFIMASLQRRISTLPLVSDSSSSSSSDMSMSSGNAPTSTFPSQTTMAQPELFPPSDDDYLEEEDPLQELEDLLLEGQEEEE
jgi:hypothetical protein